MTESNGHINGYLTPDQISFYDETLKKQIEGSYRYDGKAIHVRSVKVLPLPILAHAPIILR
jgi:hypothetical protein